MDFITVPLVVGIITLGIYKLFELFARKEERLAMIEKISDKLDVSMDTTRFSFPVKSSGSSVFITLKFACLLLGVGLGLLVGYFICLNTIPGFGTMEDLRGNAFQNAGVIYGATVFLFGGLSLLVAFIIEMKYVKNKKAE